MAATARDDSDGRFGVLEAQDALDGAEGPVVVAMWEGRALPTLSELQESALRRELRVLGAALVVSSSAGTWWFDPERERQRFEAPRVREGKREEDTQEENVLVLLGGPLTRGSGALTKNREVRFVHRWGSRASEGAGDSSSAHAFVERLLEGLRLAARGRHGGSDQRNGNPNPSRAWRKRSRPLSDWGPET